MGASLLSSCSKQDGTTDTRTVTTSVLKSSCEDQIAILEVKLETLWDAKKRAKIQKQINDLLNDPNCYELTTVQIQIPVNESSDGLFNRTTQLGDVTSANNQYELVGVNHSEETNTIHKKDPANPNWIKDEVAIKFNMIWDRQPGDFFRIQ